MGPFDDDEDDEDEGYLARLAQKVMANDRQRMHDVYAQIDHTLPQRTKGGRFVPGPVEA